MIKEIIINVFDSFYKGIIKKDKSFAGGKKIVIETTGGTMCISTELFKKEIEDYDSDNN